MDQSKKYTLLMSKDDTKKIGHNLDTSLLDFSTEVYSEQQVSMIGNLSLTQPLFEDQFFLQNTLHFETHSTLSFTACFFKRNTFWSNNSYHLNSQEYNCHSVNVLFYNTSSETLEDNIALITTIEHQE